MNRVLVVDDERPIRLALKRILSRMDCDVTEAEDGLDAQAKLSQAEFELVITDLCMPRADGFVVLDAARALTPAPPVVILTGHGTANDCLQAMRAGAIDFMSKPFHPDELRRVVADALQRNPRRAPGADTHSNAADSAQAMLIGDSPELRALLDQVERMADVETTVLLIGERHTGKPAMARLLHALSHRSGGPLITLDCGALSAAAIDTALGSGASELSKIAAAEHGMLVLTEIERLAPELQAHTLSMLERSTRAGADAKPAPNVRLVIDIESTLDDSGQAQALASAAQEVLGGVIIQVPSIRERSDDVPLLIEHFVAIASQHLGRPVNAQTLLTTLGGYAWPGNLKELETRIARFVTVAPPDVSHEPFARPHEFAVPVDRLAVTLVLHDGSRHEVLLPQGPGLPVDSLFSSKEPFVPVREHDKTQIYARSVLASVSVHGSERHDEDDGLPRNVRAVRVHLMSGVVLTGDLRYVVVAGRSRVTDVLNEPSPSFTLYEKDLIHYVAKVHVARVEEC